MPERIFEASPKLGLMVTTYGTGAYVHLHLEAARRFAPGLPVLVHDDCSPNYAELLALCGRYGATLVSTSSNLGRDKGDLASFGAGLLWAHQCGLDLLVKMSRRWIPLRPWTEELGALALASQAATYSGECRYYHFGFRTECLALHVPSWLEHLATLRHLVANQRRGLVEAAIHAIARTIWTRSCKACLEWQQRTTQDLEVLGSDGYCCWAFVNGNRHQRSAAHLWHDVDLPARYLEVAKSWGLGYGLEEFRV